jgi:hypothetical protein
MICNGQRIADGIAGFIVDRWRLKGALGAGRTSVIYPHPFLNFRRIDLGPAPIGHTAIAAMAAAMWCWVSI